MKTLNILFKLGEELTHDELRQAWSRITGRSLSPRTSGAEAARTLAAKTPNRFEFEVNRARGFAWDLEELVNA